MLSGSLQQLISTLLKQEASSPNQPCMGQSPPKNWLPDSSAQPIFSSDDWSQTVGQKTLCPFHLSSKVLRWLVWEVDDLTPPSSEVWVNAYITEKHFNPTLYYHELVFIPSIKSKPQEGCLKFKVNVALFLLNVSWIEIDA